MNDAFIIFALSACCVALGWLLAGGSNRKLLKQIMATQKQLADDLALVLAQQKKTAQEIKSVQDAVDAQTVKIAELEALVAAGGTIGQELIDAVAAVKAQAQAIDDQIPDALTPEPTE